MIERAFGGLEVRFYADFKMIVTSQIKRQLLSPKGTETKATFFSTFPLWSTTTEVAVADWKASKEKRFPLKRYFSSGFFSVHKAKSIQLMVEEADFFEAFFLWAVQYFWT